MDIDNIPFVPHDEMNGLVRLAAEALQHGARPVDHVQIIYDIARHLAQAHARAVHTGLRVALHIAARTHAGQQTVNRAFVQAGFRRQAADAHAVAAAAQSFQQIECAVERLNGRLLRHENASLRSVL